MRSDRPVELVVGSAQLGLAYGAANRTGKPDRKSALRLVTKAVAAGVGTFDTARAYGDSEDRLGEALKDRPIRTITKLSPLTELSSQAASDAVIAAVDDSIAKSLAALKRERLDCLLLHRASQLTAFDGAVWKRLEHHLAVGSVATLGVSVQSPAEALSALEYPHVQHLQLPFNLLDWRWAESGVIDALRRKPEVTIHARSVFLQGLLACGDPHLWPSADNMEAASLIFWLNENVRKFGRLSAADLCIAYVRGQNWIDGVVIGMETEAQLETNLFLCTRPPLTAGDCQAIEACRPLVPERLLDPARWPRP